MCPSSGQSISCQCLKFSKNSFHWRQLDQFWNISTGYNRITFFIQSNQRLGLTITSGTLIGNTNCLYSCIFQCDDASNKVSIRVAVTFFCYNCTITSQTVCNLSNKLSGTLFLFQRNVQVGHDNTQEIDSLTMFTVQSLNVRTILEIIGRPFGENRHKTARYHCTIQNLVWMHHCWNNMVHIPSINQIVVSHLFHLGLWLHNINHRW